jgi:REP-associated tyrosine transposase
MPRRPRGPATDCVYHVLNRAVRRALLFETEADYAAFEWVLLQTVQRIPTRVIAYSAMPTHFHLVLWPDARGQLSQFMHWLTCTHAQRWHAVHETSGTGPVYQGRYKAIPVETDAHVLRVCRYVERNALRAGLVPRAEDWRWSSLWRRHNFCTDTFLHDWPVPCPANWIEHVNQPQSETELEAVRWAVRRGAPFGSDNWRTERARLLGVNPEFPGRGRRRKP